MPIPQVTRPVSHCIIVQKQGQYPKDRLLILFVWVVLVLWSFRGGN